MILIVGMKRSELIELGLIIKAKRESQNLTQFELAERCEVDRNYIGMLERGERNPSYLSLLKISKGLKLKVYDLIKP
jgi:transcriptional regulator with XRE-family HTH domain